MGGLARILAVALLASVIAAVAAGPAASGSPTVMAIAYQPDFCEDGPDYLFASNTARSWEMQLPGYVDNRIMAAPTGDRVAYSTENGGLLIERVADGRTLGKPVRVTGEHWDSVHWAPDGRRFVADRPGKSQYESAWIVDAATGHRTQLALPAAAYVLDAAVPSSGSPVVLYRVKSRSGIAVVAAGVRHFIASPRDSDSDYVLLAISPDGRRLAFLDGARRPVQVVDLRGHAKRYSIRPPAHTEVSRFQWLPGGLTLALTYQPKSSSHARGGLMLATRGARSRMLPGVSLLDVTTGGFLATDVLNGGPQSEIRVRAASGQVLRRLHPGTPVLAAKWIKGRWLAVTSPDDLVVRLVDSYSGSVTRLAALPRDRFYEPRISPFGAHAADC